ncbi:hypothetical protein AAX05_04930 [Moraxella bovoculi]|uniref:Uncharacterized protein n=1 Tax=Moraxella bovoculi TaxID=386891 RepID=A0AAC8PVQ1_9GAMM|nr:hypothetical protein AAX06_06375 [Moraxella bovoculi]AKG09618.1 hypothetical protein AAX05_04930 [Moraxella bovoculi]AKG11435.1 hypothetical protein AAX07_04905 [Moraxella bovoculi]AKG13442.1 hypothetical protein AAX11_04675 [Moraxella bovoculi]
MNLDKICLIIPIFISIIVSIERDKKYYFDFYEFFLFLFISLMVFIDIWNYIRGKVFGLLVIN